MNSNWCRNEQVTGGNGASGGIGFCGALTLLFIALKLLNVTVVANWSWWWVFAPLWIPTVVVLGILLIIFIIAWIVSVVE